MQIRYIDREDFIQDTDEHPTYRVTLVGDDRTPSPYTNVETELEITEVANFSELQSWIAQNAKGRQVHAWLRAWDIDGDGNPYPCLFQLL